VKLVQAYIYRSGVKIQKSLLTQRVLKWIEESIDEYVYIHTLPTLFLVEKGYIEVYDSENILLTFEELFKLFSRMDPFLLSKYVVFRDLALKGFYIKDISTDELLVFEVKKQLNESPWYILILEEGRIINIDVIRNILDKMGSETKSIIACVERRGGVTYYEFSKFNVRRNVD
jgi:tRNA splicing endonuclease